MQKSSLTQMDIGKWFRHIEYMVGILNSISDRKRAESLTKSLIKSSKMFLVIANDYFDQTNSDDVEVMINRMEMILKNLDQKIITNKQLSLDTNPYENITFFELEKWKQNIMYMVGIMYSLKDDEQILFKNKIRHSIKILFVYALCYLNELNEDQRKINDVNILLYQIINIFNNLKR
jgi:hypothetical protein